MSDLGVAPLSSITSGATIELQSEYPAIFVPFYTRTPIRRS